MQWTEFRFFDVHAADPVSVAFETAGQMTADESALPVTELLSSSCHKGWVYLTSH